MQFDHKYLCIEKKMTENTFSPSFLQWLYNSFKNHKIYRCYFLKEKKICVIAFYLGMFINEKCKVTTRLVQK